MSAEELRRRAEVLFGEHAESGGRAESGERAGPGERAREQGESGQGPPGPPGSDAGETSQGDWTGGTGAAAPVPAPAGAHGGGSPVGVGAHGGGGSVAAGAHGGGGGSVAAGEWRQRAGLSLRERMPLWLQTRCGLERRNVLALTVVLVVAAAIAVQHFWTGRTQSVRPPEVVRAAAPYGEEPGRGGRTGAEGPDASAGPAQATGVSGAAAAVGAAGAAGSAQIVVDVGGKVREPGIHRLPAGSRVADALRAAGGVKPGTNTDGLNRARFLVDGEQVVVGAAAPAAGAGAGGAALAGPAGGPVGGAAGGAPPAAPVSLSTATLDQLDTLPGVGPVLAQHIVDYRTRHGGFRSVDELREVNGIGDRRFADLRNLVRP